MFTRISRFFKAIFHAIIGEAEAQVPVQMLEQSTREMLENLRALREATATTIAFETQAKRETDVQRSRLKNLERQAEEALKQGNEKLARRALQMQIEAKATAERAEQTLKAAKVRADNARAKLKIERADEGKWRVDFDEEWATNGPPPEAKPAEDPAPEPEAPAEAPLAQSKAG